MKPNKNPYRGFANKQRREQARLDSPVPDYPKPLRGLRRIVIAVDFDFTPHAVIVRCGKSNRCNSYQLAKGTIIDSDLLKILERIGDLAEPVTAIPGRNGWSKAIEVVRKSFKPIGATNNFI
ncbi:MAG: hypothetical protein PHC43_05275 [Candidatus Marinimicrobia bacterium]|jgi:hypothetical protein|nr:hypothetical protein [Candidatus Neomarinimicrobiota bacterium]